MRKLRTLQEFLRERLADREKALGYLDVSLEEYQIDGDTSFLLKGLRNVIEAQGGVGVLAKQTQIEAAVLLAVLSSKEAPRLDMLINIITALGGQLSIVPLEAVDPSVEVATTDRGVAPREPAPPRVEVATESR
jgi:DNA-binding phage protein